MAAAPPGVDQGATRGLVGVVVSRMRASPFYRKSAKAIFWAAPSSPASAALKLLGSVSFWLLPASELD